VLARERTRKLRQSEPEWGRGFSYTCGGWGGAQESLPRGKSEKGGDAAQRLEYVNPTDGLSNLYN